MAKDLLTTCQTHFFHSLDMLSKVPDRCPGKLWHEKKGGFIFWQQLLHTLEGMHYWLRLSAEPFRPFFPGKRIYPELEQEAVDQLSKKEIRACQEQVKKAAKAYFRGLSSSTLLEKSFVDPLRSHLDVILMQIRHIQYHVGHCNSILREAGQPAVDWKE